MTSPTVLLVHGAWADGSAWAKVMPLLDAAGLNAVAVQLPLTSLVEDVATSKRALALTEGPVVLVGHSYGGVVLTEGGDDPKVEALVYLASFGPDVGESAGSLITAKPTGLADHVSPDAEGFLKLTGEGVRSYFAQDLTPAEQTLILRAQGPPSAGAALNGAITSPAWKSKPSWYLVATEDHTIHPELQEMMAKRMGATTSRLASSHVPMMSHPRVAADLIVLASKSTGG